MKGTKLSKVIHVGILVNLDPDEPQDPLNASALGLPQPLRLACGFVGRGVVQLLAGVHLRGVAMAGGPALPGACQVGEAAAAP
eukprot:CAMPEP_0195130586 /NCGR_PEP_ID=MMETSP0448-20130528/143493_1 /TAXON_ID=66468 /ORGANISM="Heterocapsa triquestra, Strain CCMP 448" /LENGTH=82 /DNA_ID=CAMNT_0040168503 /DNA_START=298 /DNA_END=543 /DNA_ORIENTATION=+